MSGHLSHNSSFVLVSLSSLLSSLPPIVVSPPSFPSSRWGVRRRQVGERPINPLRPYPTPPFPTPHLWGSPSHSRPTTDKVGHPPRPCPTSYPLLLSVPSRGERDGPHRRSFRIFVYQRGYSGKGWSVQVTPGRSRPTSTEDSRPLKEISGEVGDPPLSKNDHDFLTEWQRTNHWGTKVGDLLVRVRNLSEINLYHPPRLPILSEGSHWVWTWQKISYFSINDPTLCPSDTDFVWTSTLCGLTPLGLPCL